MDKLDYKKEQKELYLPKTTPVAIDVPAMTFLQVDGRGNPNEAEGEYQEAVGLLYALSYTIKMMPKTGREPQGYFEYVIPPLEGLWWLEGEGEFFTGEKSKFCWTAMIRQPDFVTRELLSAACEQARRKRLELKTEKARLTRLAEGICVQCMHLGAYDDEPATLERMHSYAKEKHLVEDFSDTRRHHEIYLGAPRKTEVSKLRTVLRIPVRKES